MPETPEYYCIKIAINNTLKCGMVVEAVEKPHRLFEDRKISDEAVNCNRSDFSFLQNATFFNCYSCNTEFALIFK